MNISFEEAAFGVKKKIKLNKYTECSHCHGNGAEPGSSKSTCPKCGGSGQMRTTQQTVFGTFQSVNTCDRCGGKGTIIDNPCRECGGSGRIRKDVSISVEIPAGVDNESVVSVRGQGEPGVNGGPAGDLYLIMAVSPHELFTRKGYDLWLEMPISFTQAALGDDITVPTLEGKVSYKVPAGTQPGTVFRLKDKGIKNLQSARKGDLYVKVSLEVPTKLNAEQKKLIEELNKKIGSECYQKKKSFADRMKNMFK